MVIHIVRMLFLVVVVAFTVSFAFQKEVHSDQPGFVTAYILVPVLLAFVIVMVDFLWRRKRLQVLSGLFFGVLAGLVIAYTLTLIVNLVVALFPAPPVTPHPGPQPVRPDTSNMSGEHAEQATKEFIQRNERYEEVQKAYMRYMSRVRTVQLLKLLLGAAAVFLCVTFVLQTKDDFRFVIPYVEFSKQIKGARPILLDTSVIIDGRIADIAETRILESQVIVPRFILNELQAIADSDERLKRNRGRRGLDILKRLQNIAAVDMQILEANVPSVEQAGNVDAKLVALAQHLDGRIVTNDYNLNKIAQLRGLTVININDLANALKPIVLPGESLTVKIIKPGEEAGQGVGYLEDGTMIVAEQGRDHIGKEITIAVTSTLQTSAGRMIFGRLDPDKTYGRPEKAPQ